MIVLHQFVTDFDLPNPSPFCMKVEGFLRLAQLEYQVVPWTPGKAPMGKAPVVEIDDKVFADSTVILRSLIRRRGLKMDKHLAPKRKALLRTVVRALEEHTYWALMQSRWVDEDGWQQYRHVIGSSIPLPGFIKPVMLGWLRRTVVADANSHGLCRHEPKEIHRRAMQDIDGLEALFEGDYLGGEHPCSLDAAAFAFIENLAHPMPDEDHPVRQHILGNATLTGWMTRMRARLWPERSFPELP